MYYRKDPDNTGDYRSEEGERYSLIGVLNVRPADGWTWFDTTEECLTVWGLTPETPSSSPK